MSAFDTVPRHGSVLNWLGPEAIDQLLGYVRANSRLLHDSETEEGVNKERRVSRVMSLGPLKGEIEQRVRASLPGIFETLGVRPFDPTLETEVAAHGNGAFFKLHADTGRQHERRISMVYYFPRLPKAFSGGVLRLHSLSASGQEGT